MKTEILPISAPQTSPIPAVGQLFRGHYALTDPVEVFLRLHDEDGACAFHDESAEPETGVVYGALVNPDLSHPRHNVLGLVYRIPFEHITKLLGTIGPDGEIIPPPSPEGPEVKLPKVGDLFIPYKESKMVCVLTEYIRGGESIKYRGIRAASIGGGCYEGTQFTFNLCECQAVEIAGVKDDGTVQFRRILEQA